MSEFQSGQSSSSLTFTDEEVDAMRQTKRQLLERAVPVSDRELAIVVMNCKLRVEKAVEKYCKWLEAMKEFGISSFDDIWEKQGLSRDGSASPGWSRVESMLSAYAGCGCDKEGRSIMWVRSRPVQPDEETIAVATGCLYYIAAHSDMTSLRGGVTFVVDTEQNDMVSGRMGNETKLQRMYQSMPLRPQKIFILGAGYLKRALINTLLAVVSLFTSEKVLDRVRFADLDEVKACVDPSALPVYKSGQGGGVQTESQLMHWIRTRLQMFPPLQRIND
jgi:hypothetical protein